MSKELTLPLLTYLTPLEQMTLPQALDGSMGANRVPIDKFRLTEANTDLEAIMAWLNDRAKRSKATRRAYLKEAERLYIWAMVVCEQPLSSLTIEAMTRYEAFIKKPDALWVAKKKDGVTVRYPRSSPKWRPFDGPLSLTSVEHTMSIIKSMFNFWCQVGYVHLNPLAIRKRVVAKRDSHHHSHVFSKAHWQFIYQYLQSQPKKIKAMQSLSDKARLKALRVASREKLIFICLYLMGLRISELASLKMNDFSFHDDEDDGHWWVSITGKGNYKRRIPATSELIGAVIEYRQFIWDHSERWKYGAKNGRHQAGDFKKLPKYFQTRPTATDPSTVLLDLIGTHSLSSNRLHTIVKNAFKAMTQSLKDEQLNNQRFVELDGSQFELATTHWMRHTSATHRANDGTNLKHVQEFLGHASIETTMNYTHSGRKEKVDALDRLTLDQKLD